jgi:hypothetical protein
MKILFLLMILFLVSCGPKSESTKAKFKIFSGYSAVQASIFPGGILIMGKNSEGDQSFILPYKENLELTLKKGNWNLAAIGWMGDKPMTGSQKCGVVRVEVRADSLDVPFTMTQDACKATYSSEALSGDGEGYFTYSSFYYSGNDVNKQIGFKKLSVSSSSSYSYKVKIPIHLKGGVLSNPALSDGLSSDCYAANTDAAATPPHGGVNGFIGVNILTFANSGCSGAVTPVFFPHGTGAEATTTSGTNYSPEFVNSNYDYATLIL